MTLTIWQLTTPTNDKTETYRATRRGTWETVEADTEAGLIDAFDAVEAKYAAAQEAERCANAQSHDEQYRVSEGTGLSGSRGPHPTRVYH